MEDSEGSRQDGVAGREALESMTDALKQTSASVDTCMTHARFIMPRADCFELSLSLELETCSKLCRRPSEYRPHVTTIGTMLVCLS